MELTGLLACYSLLQYYLFTLAFSLPLFISSQKQMTHRAKEELMQAHRTVVYTRNASQYLVSWSVIDAIHGSFLSLYPLALELQAI